MIELYLKKELSVSFFYFLNNNIFDRMFDIYKLDIYLIILNIFLLLIFV